MQWFNERNELMKMTLVPIVGGITEDEFVGSLDAAAAGWETLRGYFTSIADRYEASVWPEDGGVGGLSPEQLLAIAESPFGRSAGVGAERQRERVASRA